MAKSKDEVYLDEMYARQKESALTALKSEYDANVTQADKGKAETEQKYYDAKREAAGDAARAKLNMNERFAANGLNTGTAGQAALALQNQANANLGALDEAGAKAAADFETAKTELTRAYQAAVQKAISDNDAEKAAALYDLYKEKMAEAKDQVNTMLSAGVMPDAALIEQSGYGADYVSKLYNALNGASGGGYSGSGGGGNLPTDEPKSEWGTGVSDVQYKGMRETLYRGKQKYGSAWAAQKLAEYVNNSNITEAQAVQLGRYAGIDLE